MICESLRKKMIGKPYSGKPNVRFDEGELEIEPLATTPALYSTELTIPPFRKLLFEIFPSLKFQSGVYYTLKTQRGLAFSEERSSNTKENISLLNKGKSKVASEISTKRVAVRIILAIIVLTGVLFGTAGTLNWIRKLVPGNGN